MAVNGSELRWDEHFRFGQRFCAWMKPLSALDSETRQQMFELLKEVRAHTGVTALHVTHNRDEAEALADRVLQFEDGEVVEISW